MLRWAGHGVLPVSRTSYGVWPNLSPHSQPRALRHTSLSVMRHKKSHKVRLSRRLNLSPSRDFARKNTAHAWTDGPPPATFTVR